jgi:hypothetical protein
MSRHQTGPVPYPLAMMITLVVEVPIYLLVFRFAGLLPLRSGLAVAAGLNLLTHPLAWWLMSSHPGWFLPVEAGVWLVETGLLWALVRRDAAVLLLTALVANLASILAGHLIS